MRLEKLYQKELRKNYWDLIEKLESIVGITYYWKNQRFYVEVNRLAQIETLPNVPMFIKMTSSGSYVVEYRAIAIESIGFEKLAKLLADTLPYNNDTSFQVI